MTSLFELVNQLGVLAVGRRPVWQTPDAFADSTGVPQSLADGRSTQSAVRTIVQIDCRAQGIGAQRTLLAPDPSSDGVGFWIDLSGFDAAGDYIETQVQYSWSIIPDPSRAALAQGIVDAVNADADAIKLVTASVDASVPGSELVVLTGITSNPMRIVPTIEGATNPLFVVETIDATIARARIYRLPAGSATSRPGWALYQELPLVDWRGAQVDVPTAGFSRVFVEIYGADGDGQVTIGPCLAES